VEFDPLLYFVDIVCKVGREFGLGFEAELSIHYPVESEWPSCIRTLELVLNGVNEKRERDVGFLVGHFSEFAASFGGFWLFAERKGFSAWPFVRRVGLCDVDSQEDGFVRVFFAHLFKK